MAIPLPPGDPAAWMVSRGRAEQWAEAHGAVIPESERWVTPTHGEIYKVSCYICNDEEFALMGLPVCKPCPLCGVHWAADDSVCDEGHDVQEYYFLEGPMKDYKDLDEEGRYGRWSDYATQFTALGLEPRLSYVAWCEQQEAHEELA